MLQLLKFLFVGKDKFAQEWFDKILEATERLSKSGQRKLFKTVLAMLLVFILCILFIVVAHDKDFFLQGIQAFLTAICVLAGVYSVANSVEHATDGGKKKNGK